MMTWMMRRIRFRTSALLWLTVVVAAFFCGRRSDDLQKHANRWWQVTRVRLGADANRYYRVMHWPPGSLTVNEGFTINVTGVNDPDVAAVALLGSRQLRISPKSDGTAVISYTTSGGTYSTHKLQITVENGKVDSDWTLTGSP